MAHPGNTRPCPRRTSNVRYRTHRAGMNDPVYHIPPGPRRQTPLLVNPRTGEESHRPPVPWAPDALPYAGHNRASRSRHALQASAVNRE